MYQRLGFQCLGETLFEEAGNHLFAGDLDPRALVSYYPELYGSLFGPTEALDIFSGVVEHMPRETSVNDISEHRFRIALYPHRITFEYMASPPSLSSHSSLSIPISTYF